MDGLERAVYEIFMGNRSGGIKTILHSNPPASYAQCSKVDTYLHIGWLLKFVISYCRSMFQQPFDSVKLSKSQDTTEHQ